MAKYLNFNVTGGFVIPNPAPELDGDQLVQLGQISTFTVTTTGTNGGANADAQIVLNLAGLPGTAGPGGADPSGTYRGHRRWRRGRPGE